MRRTRAHIKLFLVLVAIGVTCAIASCRSEPHQGHRSNPPQVAHHTTEIRGVADEIDDARAKIDAQVDAGEQQAPDLPAWPAIREQTLRIGSGAVTIKTVAGELDQVQEHIDQVTAQRDRYVRELEDARNQAAWSRYLWLITLGVAVIAVGVGVLFLGNLKFGGAAIGVGLSLIAAGQFLRAIDPWLPWIAGLALVGGIAFAVWQGWRNRTAAREVVREIDSVIRPLLPAEQWEQVKAALRRDQSKTTRSIVAEAKRERD